MNVQAKKAYEAYTQSMHGSHASARYENLAPTERAAWDAVAAALGHAAPAETEGRKQHAVGEEV